MAQPYFSLVTTIGRIKLAASASGGPAVTITHFAIGDGNGNETNPTAASTALVREVWRTAVESVHPDPLNPAAILTTAIIPTNHGGWWMREFGIFDADGDMIAVAKPVSQYKPTAAEGQLEDIRYEFQIIIGETANVTLLVDPSILLASRLWVESRKTPINRLLQTPWLPVKAMSVTNPPANAAEGDIYVIPVAASGAWDGHAGKLAEWTGTAWVIFGTPDGHGVSLPDGRVFERIAGTYVEKLALDAQSGRWNFAAAGGTANALTTTLSPAPVAYVAGLVVRTVITAKNTGAVTLNVNGLGPKAVASLSGKALIAGDLIPGLATFVYDGAKFVVSVGAPISRAGMSFTVAGTFNFVVPDGVYFIDATVVGAGGGGGGCSSSSSAGGGGGGGGGCAKGVYAVTPGDVISITVGAGGIGGLGVTANAGSGGASSFGSFATATGGAPGGSSTGGEMIGGAGGLVGVGGDLNSKGQGGASSWINVGLATGGIGGSSALSGSGGGASTSGSPSSVSGPAGYLGSGGHGGCAINATANGGKGGDGGVMLRW